MNRSRLVGLLFTVVFHSSLLLVCVNSGLKYIYPPPEEKTVVLEFEPEEIPQVKMPRGIEPRVEEPSPDKEIKLVQSSEAALKGTKVSESDATTVGDVGDVEVPEPEREQIDTRALFSSAANTKKDTLGAQTASVVSESLRAGHPSGNTERGAADGTPSAKLAGRTVMGALPLPMYDVQKSGRVVVRIAVNQNGTVTSAIPGAAGTSVNDRVLWAAAKNAALKAKFNVSSSAPVSQEGTITYVFRLR